MKLTIVAPEASCGRHLFAVVQPMSDPNHSYFYPVTHLGGDRHEVSVGLGPKTINRQMSFSVHLAWLDRAAFDAVQAEWRDNEARYNNYGMAPPTGTTIVDSISVLRNQDS